jgi:hypothetical protein
MHKPVKRRDERLYTYIDAVIRAQKPRFPIRLRTVLILCRDEADVRNSLHFIRRNTNWL